MEKGSGCRATTSVIANEFRVLIRSARWVILLIVFAAFAIFAHYISSTDSPLFAQYVPLAVDGVLRTIPLSIPIVGILMGFDLVSDEIETNRLSLVLSNAIGRRTLYLAKFLARFLLSASVVALASLVAYLSFGASQDLASEFLVRFGILLAIFFLGVLFWLSLSSLFSTVTKRSIASLLYCILLLPYLGFGVDGSGTFTEILASLIFQGPLPNGGGFSNLPIYFEITNQYSLSVYLRYLVPQQSILAPASGLFAMNNQEFIYATLWKWFTTYVGYNDIPPNGGLPGFVPLVYLAVLSAIFLAYGVYLFRKTDV